METTCKNCNTQFAGNYCNNCGQSAKVHRVDFHFLMEDIEHGILHYDKGIGYSLRRLFRKPGAEIRNYMAGKRVGHFRPLSLSIILATVYALIYHLADVKITGSTDSEALLHLKRVMKYYSWYVLFTIPVFAFATKTAFKVKSLNFAELIIFEAFKSSQRLVVHILFLPVFYLLSANPGFISVANYILITLDFMLILWTNSQFFNHIKLSHVALKSFFAYAIHTLVIMVFLIIIILAGNYLSVTII